jgi:acetate kinase
MGGLDVIVFTGGIGENSSMVREQVLMDLEFLGIELDKKKNKASVVGERKISKDTSKVSVFVIPTNEELVIALDTMQIVKGQGKK